MTLDGFEQAPQITRVRGDEGTRIRAFPRAHRLEGAPHVVFESQRGQLAGGDPTEGELSRPRSLANGTKPHLANPCKRFNGRVSGPCSLPLSNGAWAST
jgi:hypothetical protein